MPFEVVSSNPGTVYEVDNGDIVFLPVGIVLTSPGDGFDANPGGAFSLADVTLQIHGQVYSGERAIDFWGSLAGTNVYNNSTIFIGETGLLSGLSKGILAESGSGNQIQNYGQINGGDGIFSYGGVNSQILNAGLISGTAANGIFVSGEVETAGAPGTVITNLSGGTITGRQAAIQLSDIAGGSSILNHGMITSPLGVGIQLDGTAPLQSLITVTNHGTIQGLAASYLGSVNADRLVNRGDMIGSVLMGDGADIFDTRNGSVQGDVDLGAGNDILDTRSGFVDGAILGGDGTDRFILNAAVAEAVEGGAQDDTIDFRLGPSVTVALDGSFANLGAALGDTYASVERVLGSIAGNDVIRGSSGVNQLFGNAGADLLDGAGGSDIVQGGEGIDTLTGGLGNDTFRFIALNECGDQITDFTNVAGDNDRFQILATAFGGGLVAGTLAAGQFVTGPVALDADDRFIFNPGNGHLRYDADGAGGLASILVADLQAGATMTAADILIF